jgi:hypothetical protein
VSLLIVTSTGERDGALLHEKNCVKGSVGAMFSRKLMSLLLVHAFKLYKYGA